MKRVQVTCPSCGARLAVTDEHVKEFVRCGRCKHKFEVAKQPADVMEDVIASWLSEDDSKEPEDQPVAAPDDTALMAEQPVADAEAPETPEAAPSVGGSIRCVKVESRGALFEFPPSRLLETSFRGAFPRQCVSCDSRTHLRAHVVIFSSQLKDSISMEAEHSAGGLMLSNEEVRGLSNEEVLNRLRRVPNVPHPADLPMPYWVCDMCSGAGMVSGQIQVNRQTGKGRCRLFIRHLRRAVEFMAAAGGEGAEGLDALRERVAKTAENPWTSLPEVVRHRLEQWYHPDKAELFLTYVPDRDRGRAEDGMAGLVISQARLIYHTPRSHHEAKATEPVELQHASGGGKGSVSIKAPGWQVRHLTVDRDGLTRMRRALSKAKFHAVWH